MEQKTCQFLMRVEHGTEDLAVLREESIQLGIRVCEWEEWLATDDDKTVLGVE